MFVFLLLGVFSQFTSGKTNVSCGENPADIGFLVDGSASVELDNFKITKSFVIDFIKFFNIGDKFTKISLFQFDDQMQDGFHFKQYSTKTQIEKAIFDIVYSDGLTDFEIPLTFAKEQMFKPSNGARNSAKKILVFITDGIAYLSAAPGNALRDMDVAVYVVAVGGGVDNNTLQLIATNTSYIYTVSDYSMIWNIKDLLTSQTCKETSEHVKEVHPCTINKDLCQHGGTCQITGTSNYKCYCVTGYTGNNCQTDIDECQNVKCHNNGTCIDHVGYFTCVCLVPYTGVYCETNWCEPVSADVVFLIDISASTTMLSLEHAAKHIESTVKDWIIASAHFQIALVSFSKSSKVVLQFSDVMTKSALLKQVENLTVLQQSSEIDTGLIMAQNLLLDNRRPNVKMKIILYSDGFPSSPKNLKYVVNDIRFHHIEIYVVAIGNDVSHYFLSIIGGDISRVFPRHSNSLWHHIMKDLIRPECNACTNSEETDIVLMVDTTAQNTDHLDKDIPSILLKIVSKIKVGIYVTKLALMTYDETTLLRFAFDVYSESNKMDLQRTLSSYEQSSSLDANLTNAFQKAVEMLYDLSLGARTNAKKVILIISDFKNRIPKIDLSKYLHGKFIDVNAISVVDNESSFEAMAELVTSPFHIGTTGSFEFNQIDLFIDSFVNQLKTLECRLIV